MLRSQHRRHRAVAPITSMNKKRRAHLFFKMATLYQNIAMQLAHGAVTDADRSFAKFMSVNARHLTTMTIECSCTGDKSACC